MFGIASGSAIGPFAITDWRTNNQTDTTGRTGESLSLTGGESTGIFLVFGDSIAANYGVTAYTPASSKVHELNIYDGAMYRCKAPCLGASGALDSFVPRLGQNLITAGTFARLIFVNSAESGAYISEWGPDGNYGHRLMVMIQRARSIKQATGETAPVTGILCAIGPNDATISVSQAQWEASFAKARASIRAAGCNAPIFVAKVSRVAGVNNTAVRAAQAAVVNGVDVFAGPDLDGLARQADGTHLSDTGMADAATGWTTILDAVF